jgi:hypothetical protein
MIQNDQRGMYANVGKVTKNPMVYCLAVPLMFIFWGRPSFSDKPKYHVKLVIYPHYIPEKIMVG